MKPFAAFCEGFGVQDPESMERPLPQSEVPRMSDERYFQMVRDGLAKAKARKVARARQEGFSDGE